MSPEEAGKQGLGVLARDTVRTILVVSDDGDMAVALHERVDRAYALVRDVRGEELPQGIAACAPWPWMLVGATPTIPSGSLAELKERPVIIHWMAGKEPEGLPAHAQPFERFSQLAERVKTALTQEVAGMRLSLGLGVELPDGTLARSSELQALVSAHPYPFDVPLDAFRSAGRVLAQHRIGWRPARYQLPSGASGVALVDVGALEADGGLTERGGKA